MLLCEKNVVEFELCKGPIYEKYWRANAASIGNVSVYGCVACESLFAAAKKVLDMA